MKRIYLTSVFVLLLILSCKKDRVCSCTITKTGTSTTNGSVAASVIPGIPPIKLADTSFTNNVLEIQFADKKMKKVTKRRAKNNCISYTEPYYETTPISVPASSFNLVVSVINKGEREYKCELK